MDISSFSRNALSTIWKALLDPQTCDIHTPEDWYVVSEEDVQEEENLSAQGAGEEEEGLPTIWYDSTPGESRVREGRWACLGHGPGAGYAGGGLRRPGRERAHISVESIRGNLELRFESARPRGLASDSSQLHEREPSAQSYERFRFVYQVSGRETEGRAPLPRGQFFRGFEAARGFSHAPFDHAAGPFFRLELREPSSAADCQQ